MRMRTFTVMAGAAIVLAATATAGSAGHESGPDGHGAPLSAELSGAEEVPGPGDPDGGGTAHITLNPGQRTVCWELTAVDIVPATAAHIHVAPAGLSGPVAVPLSPPSDGSSSGCAEVSRDLVRDILRNPAEYYVNVHNPEYPAGALRGQLSR